MVVIRWLRNLFRGRKAILDSNFWCEKHRKMVEDSGVDPIRATEAICVGLNLAGFPIRATEKACCNFTDNTVWGVLQLYRDEIAHE